MKIIASLSKRSRGYILLMVMALCAASIIILAGVLSYTYSTSNLDMRSNQLSLCQNAAEACTEQVYSKLAYDFQEDGLQEVSNNLTTYQQIHPTAYDSSYFSQYHFYSPAAPNSSNTYVYVGYLTNYGGPLPTQYTNDYATSNSPIYRIVSNVTMPSSYANNVIGTAQEDVLLALVPINTYAIFYNGELEFSDCDTMTVSGRTHSNSDICTGSSDDLTFNGEVTTSSVIQSPERGGISYSPVNEHVTYNSGSATDVVSVGISIPMTNTHSIIQIQSPSVVSPTSIQGQQMEYYQANVVLIVTNTPSAAYGPNPLVYLTLQNAYNESVPANDPLPYVFSITNASTGILQTNSNNWNGTNTVLGANKISLPFLTLTNTFTDVREYQTNMYVTQIDVGAYANWVLTNSVITNKMQATSGEFPLILYVADERNIGTNKLSVVRLANAQRLPYNNNIGWTLATQNPLYIWGNYNTTTDNINYSLAIGSTTNGYTVPSALLSDALTILSSNWHDTNSTKGYSSRTPANTTLNAAIVTGNVPSTGTSATTFSGGVHNLTRLLEDWTGYTLTYNTSIVCLYTSQMATNQFQMPGNYYEAPTRQWGFDPTFYNPSREPPGIPVALVPIRFNWLQPPPGTITTGIN